MKTKKMVFTGLITALALVSFVIEGAIPPITPIYGIKLGIANVFTLFALYVLGTYEAAAVLFIRIFLGTIFAGQAVSFIYSMAGGVLSFVFMLILKRYFTINRVWVLSVICAVAHNTGQIIAAIFMLQSFAIIYYLPILIISGIIAGAFTGVCAEFVLLRIQKTKFNFNKK